MTDTNHLLLSVVRDCRGSALLVADENCLDFPFAALPTTTTVISNRVDVAERARQAGLQSHFNDYDLAAATTTAHHVVYRLSKEKPVVHHIANSALAALAPGGSLWLVGGKQEGVKTFAKTVGGLFDDNATTRKEGASYVVEIRKGDAAGTAPLDDREYRKLREIFTLGDIPVVSKPGLFGWNKIDRGSELLAAHWQTWLSSISAPGPDGTPTTLDLGCGYGYLSLMAARQRSLTITATDNCAAALAACAKNFRRHGIAGEVVASDAGDTLDNAFDLLVCNPPFHQGFQQERQQTTKFLAACKRLLAPRGLALFVVNEFVPLESAARGLLGGVEIFHREAGFKLAALYH